MYIFGEFINRQVILITKKNDLKGKLVEHSGKGNSSYCLLSTSDRIVRILDKDIMCTIMVMELDQH